MNTATARKLHAEMETLIFMRMRFLKKNIRDDSVVIEDTKQAAITSKSFYKKYDLT